MKVIISEAVKQFHQQKSNRSNEDSILIKYIKQHRFYHQSFAVEHLLSQIKQQIKKYNAQNNETLNKLQQLCLYLNKDNNKYMFQIYQIVLKSPKGVTYKDIAKKTKLEIVNISHYCCRLKKMNFVELRHEKSQKVVYPKDQNTDKKNQSDQQAAPQQSISVGKPFHFHELSIVDNIWVNVSSFESYKKNGITNQDIKQKLSKTSQTKLIMKLVEQVKDTYKFDREMVSEGKIFQNRYKNVTQKIINADIQPNQQFDIHQKLSPRIQNWLKKKFPQQGHQKFLFHLINNQLKDYLSAHGPKSAKRACTPIKLVRYIKILNSLNLKWPQTQIELKKFLIDEQKDLPNGIMHKRSIIGILDGLVMKGILQKVEPYYYPLWQPEGEEVDINERQKQQQQKSMSKPRKKPHLEGISSKHQIENKVSLKQYKRQLKIRLLYAQLQQLQKSILKKAFKRIMFAKRIKTGIKMYEPETHIFNILQQIHHHPKLPKIKSDNYNDFIQKIDEYVESQGHKQSPLNVNYQVIKMFRKFPSINETDLKSKFGNNWYEKIEPLVSQNFVQKESEGIWSLKSNRYFL